MGEELEKSSFCDDDFARFVRRMRAETDLVQTWERDGKFSGAPTSAGFELEAWLVDKNARPAAQNRDFLEAVDHEMVVPELSAFNVEFNGAPQELTGFGLSRMQTELEDLWRHAVGAADKIGLRLAMIGILPTVKDSDLCIANMSESNRFKALNEQVFRMRKGRPINLKIKGEDTLDSEHFDVMLEAAATSFQIHLKIPVGKKAVNYYNASKLATPALVAVAANSPFLFGHDLWAETRIPLFEQAVSVGDWDYAERVTFGVRYLEEQLSEVFVANRQRYPVLLPQVRDTPVEDLCHLRLQNGTIWRWNRPLIGWDDDGAPHYRIEQRVVPAGPTVLDAMANAAFYYGLVTYLAEHEKPPEERAQFFTTRDNFYECAKYGLDARVRWAHIDDRPINGLIVDTFLPMAEEGLQQRGVDALDIKRYLGIIEARCMSMQNGAMWQRSFVRKYQVGMEDMLEAYVLRQETALPVHEWPL